MKTRISWYLLIIFLGLASVHPFLVSCFFNPVEPKPVPTATPRATYTPTPVPTSQPAATATPVSTPVIVDYQNFEVGNGTPGLYFDFWNNSTPFFTEVAYGGTRAMQVMFTGALAPGGSVAVNPMTDPYDFTGASVVLAWVNDPGAGKPISLMIQDGNENAATAWSDQMTQTGQWTQLTWQLSSYGGVDLTQTMNVIFSTTESNTVLFDEISKQ